MTYKSSSGIAQHALLKILMAYAVFNVTIFGQKEILQKRPKWRKTPLNFKKWIKLGGLILRQMIRRKSGKDTAIWFA